MKENNALCYTLEPTYLFVLGLLYPQKNGLPTKNWSILQAYPFWEDLT